MVETEKYMYISLKGGHKGVAPMLQVVTPTHHCITPAYIHKLNWGQEAKPQCSYVDFRVACWVGGGGIEFCNDLVNLQ